MISTVELVAEMAAIGFDLPHDSFTSRMKKAPHLLAPTGALMLMMRHAFETGR